MRVRSFVLYKFQNFVYDIGITQNDKDIFPFHYYYVNFYSSKYDAEG